MVRQIIQFCLVQFVIINLSVANATNVPSSIFAALDKTTKVVEACTANIVVLNKQTSLRKVIKLQQGKVKIVDNLSISLIKCYKEVDNKRRGIMVQIYENHIDSDPYQLFLGWLICPDQNISAFQHAIYTILLINSNE